MTDDPREALASRMAQDMVPKAWTCPTCTYENPETRPTCQRCNTFRGL